jgi:hypothetical protein
VSGADARFEEGGARPLRLRALDPDDLQIVSALAQDAVFPVEEIAWRPAERRFAILLNRFRWEAAEAHRGEPERVRAVLLAECAIAVRSQGIDNREKEAVLSLLSIAWEPATDGAGALVLTLAGDGLIRVEAEALEVVLKDVTRPYIAPSRKEPRHD